MCEEHIQPYCVYHQEVVHGELVGLGRSSIEEEPESTSAVGVALRGLGKHDSRNHLEYGSEAAQSRSVGEEGVD
jgi:hypothetical protein